MSALPAPPLVTAHRGSSAEAPENTLAAIRLAIADGADACELDVQQAADGTLLVAHDPNFLRVGGLDLDVWVATAEQIARLEAGSHFDERFRGEPYPTLGEVIEAVRGRLRLNIELKMHGNEHAFAESVTSVLHHHDFGRDCVLTSMETAILERVREIAPDLRVGKILATTTGREAALDVDLYSVERHAATVEFIEQAHRDGREVHVWTVNERADLELFLARGADSLITDHPRFAREIVDACAPA